MSKSKLVKTLDGSYHPSENCRRMAGVYYLKGDRSVEGSGHCYYFEEKDKYFKCNTGYIAFDHNLNKYVLKSSIDIEKGIVAVKGKEVIFGAFSKPLNYKPIFANIEGQVYNCLSRDLFENSFYFKERLSDGIYYERKSIDSVEFFNPIPCDQKYKTSLPYNCNKVLKHYINEYEIENKNFKETFPNLKNLNSIIDGYSFGFEFETIKGYVPEDICSKLGLIPLRDGSIDGLEYVTIPLSGEKGITSLINILKELKKRTVFDNSCSLHLHIGGVPRTESYLLALYKILCIIQDDVFDMFPIYKRKNIGVKRKSYTKPLPNSSTLNIMNPKITNKTQLLRDFDILFNYLSMGHYYSDYGNSLSKVNSHPSDPGDNGKWNVKTRYHWVNLIPIIFGNKKTVEFRIHTPTYDVDKIINFLLICTCILKFVKENEKDILDNFQNVSSIDLERLISMTARTNNIVSRTIPNYIRERKQFITNRLKANDLIADEEKFFYINNFINWDSSINSNSSDALKKSIYDINSLNNYLYNNPLVQEQAQPPQDFINDEDIDFEDEDWIPEDEEMELL